MFKIFLWLRALLFIFFVVIHTFISSLFVISLLLIKAPRSWVDWFIRDYWCKTMVKLAGIEVELSGVENIPQDTGFLYLFTHSSHLDIPVLFSQSPKSFRFGAKSSLFKIPIFGYAITLSGTLPISRENRSKVFEVYRQAEERVAKGEAFALAPEGGRRKSDEIKDFKSGPFLFAINAKMPIVPVVLCGVDRCLPNGSVFINTSRFKQKVGMRILPAMDLKGYNPEQVKQLKDQVREQMVKTYEEMKPLYLN